LHFKGGGPPAKLFNLQRNQAQPGGVDPTLDTPKRDKVAEKLTLRILKSNEVGCQIVKRGGAGGPSWSTRGLGASEGESARITSEDRGAKRGTTNGDVLDREIGGWNG